MIHHEALPMVLTILEATVSSQRAADLQAAFRHAGAEVPPGFIRSHLISTLVTSPLRSRRSQ